MSPAGGVGKLGPFAAPSRSDATRSARTPTNETERIRYANSPDRYVENGPGALQAARLTAEGSRPRSRRPFRP